jgi:hypothetical protein
MGIGRQELLVLFLVMILIFGFIAATRSRGVSKSPMRDFGKALVLLGFFVGVPSLLLGFGGGLLAGFALFALGVLVLAIRRPDREEDKPEIHVCRHCGRDLTPADPPDPFEIPEFKWQKPKSQGEPRSIHQSRRD